MMTIRVGAITVAIWAVLAANASLAEVDFTQAVGLDEPESVTIYADNSDPNQYWVPPSKLEMGIVDDGTPNIGFLHWGLIQPSIDGTISGTLNIAVRSVVDDEALPEAWKQIKQKNPYAKISPLKIDVAFMDLVLGSALFDKQAGARVKQVALLQQVAAAQEAGLDTGNDLTTAKTEIEDLEGVVVTTGDDVTVIQDPNVASTALASDIGGYQFFAISLNPNAAAVFATNGGESATNFGVRYRYRVQGIRSRVKAKITVNWSRVLEHFNTQGGGGWFSFKARHAVDIQKLEESGAVNIEIIEGAFESPSDKFSTIYHKLVSAHINGQGIFKPTLQSSPPPGAPKTQGSFFGWSASSATSYQKLEEVKNFTYTIERQTLGKKVFEIGMGFQGVCGKYPNKFVAQGVAGSGCIEEKHLKAATARYEARRKVCFEDVEAARKERFASLSQLPTPRLQEIALKNELESLSKMTNDCMSGS